MAGAQLAQVDRAITLRGDGNEAVVKAWLRTHSANTRKAYATDLSQFLEFVGQAPLGAVTLEDLQDYADHLRAVYPHPQRQRGVLPGSVALPHPPWGFLPPRISTTVNSLPTLVKCLFTIYSRIIELRFCVCRL